MYVCSYFEILPIKDMGRSNISIKNRGCCFAASFTYFLDEFIIDLYINNSTNRKNTGINTLLGKVLIRVHNCGMQLVYKDQTANPRSQNSNNLHHLKHYNEMPKKMHTTNTKLLLINDYRSKGNQKISNCAAKEKIFMNP